jgi:hypothetical protein
MKKLILISGLLLGTFAAHAQEGTFWGVDFQNQFMDQTIAFGQTSDQFGFSAYSAPMAPLWISRNISRYWSWTSTCPSGGTVVTSMSIVGNDTQINVSSGIFNPFTGSQQGVLSGFAYQPDLGILPPDFIYTANSGGPCGPSF